MVASWSLLSGWIGCFEILRNYVLFRTVGFYLGVGTTWVVDFNGCGLSRLVCLVRVTLHFLCFTYVLVVLGYMLWPKRIYLG